MDNITEPPLEAAVAASTTLMVALLLSFSFLGLLSIAFAFVAKRSRLRFLAESLVFFSSCQLAKRRGVQAVHECLSALLLVDLVNVVAAVALAAQLGTASCSYVCTRTFAVWVVSKGFMEGLHLLCALVCVLFLHNPLPGTRLQLVAMFVALSLVALIPFYLYSSEAAVNGELVVYCIMAVAILVNNCYPASGPGKVPVLVVALVTFFFIYLPKFFIQRLMGPYRYWSSLEHGFTLYEKFLIFSNFQLFLDGFLCFCVLNLPVELQQQGTHSET